MKKILVLFVCVSILFLDSVFASNVIGSIDGKRGTGLELQADGTYKWYIKKYYDEKKEMVPLAFSKKPTDEFLLNRIAEELGIKEYYTIRVENDYFLCMKSA